MAQIDAPYGFFAATGNHESFMNPGGRTLEWLASASHAQILIDSTVCTPRFCVTGRKDHSFARRRGGRASLASLAPQGADTLKPWIVLDHQPKGLTAQDTVGLRHLPTLVMSGHTHDGQFWPWTVAIDWIWPLASGLGALSGVPWYVSSGFDQWGPPVRIGSSTEVVNFVLR
jgi:predicted MPP superfamily phosphohydrolase